MNWLDGKRLFISTGSIRAPSGEWSGSQRPQGTYVRQIQQSKLGQEHQKPAVRSREQQTARPEAPKGLLNLAATQKVIDLIETQVGGNCLQGGRADSYSLNTILESPSDKSAFPKIRSCLLCIQRVSKVSVTQDCYSSLEAWLF